MPGRLRIIITALTVLLLCPATHFAQDGAKRLKIEALLDDEAAFIQSETQKGERWALIVGVNKYEDPEINPLKFAVNDAKALYDLLIEIGRFSPERMKLLTSDEADKRKRPTKANILQALNEWLAGNVKEEDTVLIFFSGHGAVQQGRRYLLPSDTDTFYMPAYAIDNREFIEGIDDLKAEKIITLLDSCHSGGVSREGKSIGDMLPDDFYADFEKAKGKVTLASCDGAQQSFEWTEKGHGAFTYFLLEGLKGGANKQRDLAVTFNEIVKYVETSVADWAKANKNREQTPRSHMDNAYGEIALTFDLATGFEMLSKEWKNTLYGKVDTGADNLSVSEIAETEKFLNHIISRLRAEGKLSETDKTALSVVSNLVGGDMTVPQYKNFGSKLVRDALQGKVNTSSASTSTSAADSSSSTTPVQPTPTGEGEIKVFIKPWAEVYLDGELEGLSPMIIRNVTAGKHTLTLKNPNFRDVTKTVEVIPNQTITVRETLK